MLVPSIFDNGDTDDFLFIAGALNFCIGVTSDSLLNAGAIGFGVVLKFDSGQHK